MCAVLLRKCNYFTILLLSRNLFIHQCFMFSQSSTEIHNIAYLQEVGILINVDSVLTVKPWLTITIGSFTTNWMVVVLRQCCCFILDYCGLAHPTLSLLHSRINSQSHYPFFVYIFLLVYILYLVAGSVTYSHVVPHE